MLHTVIFGPLQKKYFIYNDMMKTRFGVKMS